MRLNIKNVEKCTEKGNNLVFIWKDVREMVDRYVFHIESTQTQNMYYFDLYRHIEPQGGYRLMITNSKYRNSNCKKWVSINTIKSLEGLKRYVEDMIYEVSNDELWSVLNKN